MSFDIIFYIISIFLIFLLITTTYINNIYTKPIFIILFIFVFICSFKTIQDLYKNKDVMSIHKRNFDTYFKIVPEIYATVYLAFFSGWGLLLFTVLLFIGIILYSLKKINNDLIFISSYGLGITFISILAKSENIIPLFALFGIPILLVILALLLFIIIVFQYPNSKNKELMNFISMNKERIDKIKLLLSLTITFIVIGLVSPVSILNNTNITDGIDRKISDNIVTTFLIVSYVLSFILIEDSYKLFKIHLMNKKND